MTESTVVFTNETNSHAAGRDLGARLKDGLSGQTPDAVILFASSQHEYEAMLRAIHEACAPRALIGCSSAGEFASGDRGEGSASAVALRSDVMRFTAGVGRNLREDRQAAATEIAGSFRGLTMHQYPHRAALVLADALAGYTDDFIEQLSVATLGNYRFFGGGAGDDAKFAKTHVFCGTSAYTDAAVALEILSTKPIGVPIPFFLHNVLGIDTGAGFKLRVPLAVLDDGSVSCASDVPAGATVRIMKTTATSAAEAASRAVRSALGDMQGSDAGGGALLRLRRDAAPDGRRVRDRDGRTPARAWKGAVRGVQHLRPDRTIGGAVQRVSQLHGDRRAAAGLK
jgi:hypothetical protein